MADLAEKYNLPPEIVRFIGEGFLDFLRENEAEKTVEFHIPSRRYTDSKGRNTTYTVIWIHPDFNVEFCHYYLDSPGDQPNFYVVEETTDVGGDHIEGLATVADLVDWLESIKSANVW